MPVPMVQCKLCKEMVNKRSTLSLLVLGAGDGRACRKHEEVAKLVDLLADLERHKREQRAFDRAARILIAAAGVRVSVSFLGISEEELYRQFNLAGYDEGMLTEIRQAVRERGGPIMTPQEIGAITLGKLTRS